MGRQKTTGRVVKAKGVGFEPGVSEYIDFIFPKKGAGSRSAYINRLAKEDAQRNGIDLTSFIKMRDDQSNPQTA